MKSLFNTLYVNYAKDLYIYGRSLGVSHEDLQDVIHDVFLHVMERYEQLDLECKNIKLYLKEGVKNKIISNYRKQKEFSSIENVNEYRFSTRVTELEIIIKKEEHLSLTSRMKLLFQNLTERQREALFLRYMQEMSYEDIANQLRITEKGSRKLVSRAIIELRRCAV